MAKWHGRNVRVYVDGYDISGYTNSLAIDQGADVVDVAAFGSQSKEYVVGLSDSKVTHDGFFDDTASIGGHAILATRLGSAVNFMAVIGQNPGGQSYAGSAELEKSYNILASITGAVTHKVEMDNFGTQGVDLTITMAARGTIPAGTTAAVLMPPQTAGQVGGRAYIQNFGSYGLPVGQAAGAHGTIFLIGAADAGFTSGTAVIASFGDQGTAPSASGLAFTGTATYMKLLQGGGTFMPQVAVTVDML